MTDNGLAALAAAMELHFRPPDAPPGGSYTMETYRRDATAILAALDGWTLVPDGLTGPTEAEHNYVLRLAADEIATLRAEWTDHRERCHHSDPDGVIAHALAVNDEQAATIAILRAALDGLVEAGEIALMIRQDLVRDGSTSMYTALEPLRHATGEARAALATAKETP